MYEAAARSYQQTSFLTADPMRLILMCYEGAIGNLKKARDSYSKKDYLTKGMALKKTFDIIYELNSSLDVKKGGEVAANLRSLYSYMTQALTEADLKKDMDVFDAVIRMLEELEAGWRSIAASQPENVKPVLNRVPEASSRSASVGRAWSV